MKKIFALMLFVGALLMTSCEAGKALVSKQGDTDFTGTLEVVGGMPSEPQTGVIFTTTTFKDIVYPIVDVTMKDISFMPGYMPAMTIVLPDLGLSFDGSYTSDAVIPEKEDGEPYDDTIIKTIEDVKAIIGKGVLGDAETLEVTFKCIVKLGEKETTYYVTYTGTKK